MEKIVTQNVNLYYGESHALKDISLKMHEKTVTALIGPSGCGKSTYCNGMHQFLNSIGR